MLKFWDSSSPEIQSFCEVKSKFKAEEISYWDDFISDAAYVLMEMKRIREDLKYTLEF